MWIQWTSRKMQISKLQDDAKRLIQNQAFQSTTIYLLQPIKETPSRNQINRTCGNPIGITEASWPKYQGNKMEHAITLDLNDVPIIRDMLKTDARAISVFVSSLLAVDSSRPIGEQSKVIFLSQEDVERGEVEFDPTSLRRAEYDRNMAELDEARAKAGFLSRLFLKFLKKQIEVDDTKEMVEVGMFTCHEIEVPLDIFDEDIVEDSAIYELSEEILDFGFVGGKPVWMDFEQNEHQFVMQFDNRLVDMNLGDGGSMYVFNDIAFRQFR